MFAIDLLRKIIVECEDDDAHFDLELAKELNQKNNGKGEVLLFPPS